MVLAICIGFGIAFVIANLRSWELEDANAYWNAAVRLRDGQPLYVSVDPNADEMLAYRYAPWLAWVWVPLTYLPKGVVEAGWSALLLAASAVAVLPLLRNPTAAGVCLAALLGGLLVRASSTGNVHPLLVAALSLGVHRRSGPLWIGLAASLKFVPILYVIPYIGRREWRRALLALAVGALFLAPMLAYDLTAYPTDPGESFSLLSLGVVAYAIVAVLAVAAAAVTAFSRYRWAAASLAVLASIPRLDYYDLTYFLVGTKSTRSPELKEWQ